MKKSIIKITIAVLFLLIWCSPLMNKYFQGQHFVFLTGYFAGILSLVFIKNKYISFILAVVLMIPAILLNREYLFFVVCPLYITFKYIQVFKKKRKSAKENIKDKFYVGADMSLLAGFVVLLYQYINSDNSYIKSKYEASEAVIWAMFVFSVLLALICLSKKVSWKQMSSKSELRESELKEIRLIHVLNVLCYIETLLYYYFVNAYTLEYTERIFFFPCFVYFGLMVYYNDPIFGYFVEKAEKIFGRITEKLL